MSVAGVTTPLAPGIDAVGVLHGRLEFAAGARAAVTGGGYDVVALELPATLADPFRRAVDAQPYPVVIEWSWEDGRPAFLFVAPQDAFTEAARAAREAGVALRCVDAEVPGYGRGGGGYPDPYLAGRWGVAAYLNRAAPALGRARVEGDERREATIAHRLRRLAKTAGRVLFIGGVEHLAGLRRRLAAPPAPRPLGRVAPRPATVSAVARETMATLLCLGEAPHLIAAYELARAAGRPAPDRLRQAWALLEMARTRLEEREGERLAPGALAGVVNYAGRLARVRGGFAPGFLDWVTAARGVADDRFAAEVLALGTTFPFPAPAGLPSRVIREDELEGDWRAGLRLRPRQTRPRWRPPRLGSRRRPGRDRRAEWDEDWKRRDGERQCSYPPEDVVIEAAGKRVQGVAQALLSQTRAGVRPFSTGLADGVDVRETLRNWHEGRVYVRDDGKAAGGVGSVVVVFDEAEAAAGGRGGRPAAARDARPGPGPGRGPGGGADPGAFPWAATWWGEHDQESDLAFYASDPDAGVVGPGVARCEYGAFMMSYPPGRLTDVFTDPYYRAAESRLEALVAAALEYSLEPWVAYVAARPPRSRWRTLAERFGRRLVYVPLGALSRETQRRIRVFHVLADPAARAEAGRYIDP